jgi:hypothetical protein
MQAVRSFIFIVVVGIFSIASLSAAFLLGRSISPHAWPAQFAPLVPPYELARADAPQGLKLEGRDPCVTPTETESALVRAALDVLAFPDEMTIFVGTGAERFLSNPLVRRVDEEYLVVCDDPEIFRQAQMSIEEHRRLLRGRLVEYGFALIVRLPSPSAGLVRKVAESAFSDTRQESDVFRRDLRPLARATLASIEGAATAYADRAFLEITIEDSMGTGAAQIAVAGGHPQALQKVEQLMDELLAGSPPDEPIPWGKRNRLYEMAQALAYGGQAAQEHVLPLKELMNREVESNATIFGMVALPPRRMCQLLEHILRIPTAASEYKYCDPQSEDFVLEQ